jgi:hypothetical protein
MKVYAERPLRFTRQVVADVAMAAWTILWVWAAINLYDFIQQLAIPGEKLERSGDSLADNLADAQSKAGSVPLVGDRLSAPFGNAAEAARGIADAGRTQQDAVGDLATTLAWFTAAAPILVALALWIPFRAMWIRAATSAVKVRRRTGGAELLALRALATAPLRRLQALDDDIVAGWRDGDPEMIDCLARMELRRLGLRNRKLKPVS